MAHKSTCSVSEVVCPGLIVPHTHIRASGRILRVAFSALCSASSSSSKVCLVDEPSVSPSPEWLFSTWSLSCVVSWDQASMGNARLQVLVCWLCAVSRVWRPYKYMQVCFPALLLRLPVQTVLCAELTAAAQQRQSRSPKMATAA